ncbi:hypothetical protein [Luteibacter sp.]|uniref:hypothetical protein n=1 Tax=Luteibacter sp. TaxID=1886636 RepID=UPI003F816726
MKSVTVTPTHGIIFVLDPTNKEAVIPEYDHDMVVSYTSTCASVATQASVDGETELFLGQDAPEMDDLIQVAVCDISFPSGLVALMDSGDDRFSELRIGDTRATVVVWVDTLNGPTRVVVQIAPGEPS